MILNKVWPWGVTLYLILFGLTACENESTSPDTTTQNQISNIGEAGSCTHETRVGNFRIDVHPEFPSISGHVADGVVPIHKLQPVEGGSTADCVLEQRVTPTCEETCAYDQTCDYDGTCIPYPKKHGVGKIKVSGLFKKFVLEPKGDPGSIMYSESADMQVPIVEPGAEVLFEAHGDSEDFAGFSMKGIGIKPPTFADNEEVVIAKDKDLKVRWSAGSNSARITININIDQHGASPITLACDVEDTGEFVIPSFLTNKLMDSGVTGFPSLLLGRRSIEHVFIKEVESGCVEFELSHSIKRVVRVEGHIPCQSTGDCPDGMVCDQSTETCISQM